MRIAVLRFFTLLCLAVAFLAPEAAWSKPKPKGAPSAAPAASSAPAPADSAAADPSGEPQLPWKAGPMPLELGHDLSLELPTGYVFLGMPDAAKLLEKNGSFHNEDLLGVVGGADDDWFAIVRYEDSGYVKDDEKVDADELLKAFREGQEEANKERAQRGFSALTIEGWSEPPRYERGVHHLAWAMMVSSPDHGRSVNLNTRVLGRRGYASINLVTDPDKLAGYRHHGAALLEATRFKQGARYEDFDQKTDKVAEYGLIGLILGGAGLGAAVKVGLFAKLGKVLIAALIAGKKLIVVAIAAAGAFFKKIFGGKKTNG